MISITKEFHWHCAHRLVGHKGLCKGLHGHTYRLIIEVSPNDYATLNDMGMVLDFSDLREFVKKRVVDKFDHALVLWIDDPLSEELCKLKNEVYEELKIINLSFQTTAENMAKWIFTQLATTRFEILKVRLYETDTSYAEYSEKLEVLR